MRTIETKLLIVTAVVFSFIISHSAFAGTTIDTANHYAWGPNLGWMDWRGDTANGAVIGEYVCSGYIYSANVGWINLGNGAPADGIYYSNTTASDWGVNQDGLGNLRGYAWGANVGWIAFKTNGMPRVDLYTGKMSGYVWSANCGWISLSNVVAYVQTDTIAPGTDTDGDGIPDAWELQQFGNLTTANGTSDYDGDGVSDKNEYLAGTNPKDSADHLRITSVHRGLAGDPNRIDMQWTSEPTRFYAIQSRATLNSGSIWADLYVLPIVGINNVAFDDSNSQQFYRLRAFRPLTP